MPRRTWGSVSACSEGSSRTPPSLSTAHTRRADQHSRPPPLPCLPQPLPRFELFRNFPVVKAYSSRRSWRSGSPYRPYSSRIPPPPSIARIPRDHPGNSDRLQLPAPPQPLLLLEAVWRLLLQRRVHSRREGGTRRTSSGSGPSYTVHSSRIPPCLSKPGTRRVCPDIRHRPHSLPLSIHRTIFGKLPAYIEGSFRIPLGPSTAHTRRGCRRNRHCWLLHQRQLFLLCRRTPEGCSSVRTAS